MPAAVGAFILPSLAGTLTASVVGGAIVGAAIGGITAAITGGDIGKGLLFGAIGGAVTGAVTYGLSSVMNNLSVGAEATYKSGSAGTMFKEGSLVTSLGEEGGVALATRGQQAAYALGGTAAEGGAKSGFMSSLGKSLGGGFGVQAVGAGIGAIKDVYLGNKQAEMQISEAEKNRNLEREKIASAERIANAKSTSSGGSGRSGPDYTIDELIRRDLAAAGAERETVLAKVGAELSAQKALRQQEYNEAGAARQRAAAGAKVSTSGGAAGSRSTESLVDVQERIRAGENVQGDPNIGVVPPVEYVPPATVRPEDVANTA